MKYISAAVFVALICASTGFQLLPSISSLLPEISADNLEAKVDCIADVIRSVVKDDDEVATWSDDAVAEIQELKALQAENEKIENEAERFKRMKDVSTKAISVFGEFFTKIISSFRWQLIKQIKAECFDHDSNVDPIDAKQKYVADVYQYYVNIIGKVSKGNGLTALWSKTQPKLQAQLDEWKKFRGNTNDYTQVVLKCNEGKTILNLIDEYFRQVEATNAGVVAQIKKEANEKIAHFEAFEESMETYKH